MAALRGLGARSAAMLVAVGITSEAELRQLGSVAAFLRVAANGQGTPSLNLLFALEGALTDRDWREIARQDGARLRLALEDAQAGGATWGPG
ncbi:MAG: TfoX/Sxy family DNA transformation protein [Pseudomonadota bacterium]